MQIIVEDPLMRHSAILVFANKQDLVRSAIALLSFSTCQHFHTTDSGMVWACRKGRCRQRRSVRRWG